ncbi:MAG: hypothetical protein CFE24_03570 [Flavobacterium sp. BFFFF2]|nr:MAG: hypothetical protein CFE24_03570 [Flavobacterium sp. BFFFF2]
MNSRIRNKPFWHSLLFFTKQLKGKLAIILVISSFYSLMDVVGLSLFVPFYQLAQWQTDHAAQPYIWHIHNPVFEAHIGFSLVKLLVTLMIVFLIKALFRYFDVLYRAKTNTFLQHHLRVLYFDGLKRIQFPFYLQHDFGTLQATATQDIQDINYAYLHFVTIFQSGIFIGVYLSVSLLVNWRFTLILIVFSGLAQILFRKYNRHTQEASLQLTTHINAYTGFTSELLNFYKYLKATYLMDTFLVKIQHQMAEIKNKELQIAKNAAYILSVREPVIIGFIMFSLFIHVQFVQGSLADVIPALLFNYRTFGSFMTLQLAVLAVYKFSGSISQFDRMLKNFEKNRESEAVVALPMLQNAIRFESIQFAYQPEVAVLHAISMRIPKNKTTALVGSSGSGKTTITNLLMGLFIPQSGCVYWDEHQIEFNQLQSLRAKIGLIPQETVVFNDTFKYNITMGLPMTDNEEVRFLEVVAQADLMEWMQSQPQKEFTPLGDQGEVLSGGQKQRLAIARELYLNKEILILDEATSSLDAQTERHIQSHLEQLKGHVTLIVIAHRFSTIQHADNIYVLNQGNIEAEGTFTELQAKSAFFANMVRLQQMPNQGE